MHQTAPDPLALVASAVCAPSSHNTQPWLFRVSTEGVDLLADRTRALPVNDPDDRELTISCAAALFNLRVAAAHHGVACTVEVLPDAGDEDVLARLRFVDGPVDTATAALYDHITRRRTQHGPFPTDDRPGPEVIAELVAAGAAEGADLWCVGEPARAAVADLVAEGDRVQFADRRWRRELAAWMHPRRRGDGLTVPLMALPATRLVVASVDLGRSTAAKDHDLADQATLCVLATPGDRPADWMVAGQALERVLLVATAHGLRAGYLNQPCQVAALRPRLQSLVPGRAFPQVVVRLGPAPAEDRTPPAPRRPVDDVVIT